MSKLEFKTVNLLVLFIPIFLITGPFLADLALSVSSIIFIIFIIRTQQFSLLKDNYFFIFLFFYSIVIISCLQSDYIEKILFKNIFYFRFGIFLLLVKYIINTDEKFVKNLKNILLFTFILLFIDSSVQFIFGKNILGFFHPPGRITSFLNEDLSKPSASLVVKGSIFKLYFEENIDLSTIKKNLLSKQAKYQAEMDKISSRLKNKEFVNRAPKHIVVQEKNNYNNLEKDIKKISITIKNL